MKNKKLIIKTIYDILYDVDENDFNQTKEAIKIIKTIYRNKNYKFKNDIDKYWGKD